MKRKMSELEKLTFKWQREHSRRFTKHLGKYYKAVDKLQAECKHEKTHWMQELDKDGEYKKGLFKRCFICGATVEKLDADNKFIDVAMKAFDDIIEANRVPNKQVEENNQK
jgi:hypothetical protein